MREPTKKSQSLTTTITVDATPQAVFDAVVDVRAWWSGEIEGPTDVLGGEFTYRYRQLHYSKQRVTELVPGERVAWLVVDSHLAFVEDEKEWNGTTITFDIARKGGKTELRFTHVGLAPSHQCFADCSDAWGSYIRGSLRGLITKGRGKPNPRETPATRG